jgi:hypothetical protein
MGRVMKVFFNCNRIGLINSFELWPNRGECNSPLRETIQFFLYALLLAYVLVRHVTLATSAPANYEGLPNRFYPVLANNRRDQIVRGYIESRVVNGR